MRFTHAIAAFLAATAAQSPWFNPLDFKPGHGFCIPNPRNDRAAQRQCAAAKRRNKSKRG